MKLNGVEIRGANRETIVIPRGDGNHIIFIAEAVVDDSPFEKLCPVPKAPERIMKGGKRESNPADPGYVAEVEKFGLKKVAWTIIESLKATPGLEWETVNLADHTTWMNWRDELKNSGFSYIEIQRIQNGVFSANCLSEAHVEEARKSFQLGLADQANESSGLSIAPNAT